MVKKVVLVTGSSRGIGFAISKEFAENQGSTVIVCSRNINDAIRASQRIKGNTHAFQLDVTKEKDVRSVVKEVVADYGTIDILVNSAGYK
ncbi:MAG: SDR family NAD(P)-dependent oxidoreductase, partial [Nitrososphaeraceae archaeon]